MVLSGIAMDYKSTIHLPKTPFPMKADLARREPQQLAAWDQLALYTRVQAMRRGASPFILHDGPPYANGRIHIGHALNKILKDIIIKSKLLEGHAAPFVPGWDCHGLPIEHQVMKEAGPQGRALDRLEIRRRCRDYAAKFVGIQREEFQRLGCLGDWAHPYLTMEPGYEAAIVRAFGSCVKAGGVYKAKKPVLWCWHDETALAEAEVEYEDHTSPSIYVKFPFELSPKEFARKANLQMDVPPEVDTISIIIWTTTPWTLPANQAICINDEFQYAFVKEGNEVFIVADKLLDSVKKACGLTECTVLGRKGPLRSADPGQMNAGAMLEGLLCRRPLSDGLSPILYGDFVTLDQGTGCVHIAPGHGQEDYQLALMYNSPSFAKILGHPLEVFAPVDNTGRFTSEVPEFQGRRVFEANPLITQKLKEKGVLLNQVDDKQTHSYPHCWRCKNPVIFRATEQWFISMDKNNLRIRALDAIDHAVTWIPTWGKDRIHGMIAGRPDWCISRQRAWGVPIVAFRCQGCRQLHYPPTLIEHVAGLIERHPNGADLWFEQEAAALLPAGTHCPQCQGTTFAKESDILDVWFESGVSHAAVLKRRPELRWPADLYLEGSDQHRGWFHSSLLTALQTDGEPPYHAVLTHGFVVDGEGKKMSKSAGNVVAPQEVIQKHGAEILRLWVAAADYREDVRISPQILEQLVESYRRIRNTCRYLLGNLAGFDPSDRLPPSEMEEIDRWALHRLQEVIETITAAYRDYEFHLVIHTLNHFCAAELSAFYLDVLKDRLYCEAKRGRLRRSAQMALYDLLQAITRLMAPLLTFTAEEVWQTMPELWRPEAERASILLSQFPIADSALQDDTLADRWGRVFFAVREAVAKRLEDARQTKQIGSSLEAAVDIKTDKDLTQLLTHYHGDLPSLFIVSKVTVNERQPGDQTVALPYGVPAFIAVTVTRAPGSKCVRCWRYDPAVGEAADHPELCARCAPVVRAELNTI